MAKERQSLDDLRDPGQAGVSTRTEIPGVDNPLPEGLRRQRIGPDHKPVGN